MAEATTQQSLTFEHERQDLMRLRIVFCLQIAVDQSPQTDRPQSACPYRAPARCSAFAIATPVVIETLRVTRECDSNDDDDDRRDLLRFRI